MEKYYEELKEAILDVSKYSKEQLEELSYGIDQLIEYKEKDERNISYVFDALLSLAFVDEDELKKVFHKLSTYCRKFNKKLADDYDEILEEQLSDEYLD